MTHPDIEHVRLLHGLIDILWMAWDENKEQWVVYLRDMFEISKQTSLHFLILLKFKVCLIAIAIFSCSLI